MKRAIIAAALLIGSAGLANADPLKLTSVQMDGVTAGQFNFTKNININVNERIVLDKFVRTRVDLDPSAVANAEAYANCTGVCTAQTLSDTNTSFGRGTSYSGSYSATDYRFCGFGGC
jgi:hypothetical protein